MAWLVADIIISTRLLETAVWVLIGYIAAAIGWGFRVELKLAKLERDQAASATAVSAVMSDVKKIAEKQQDALIAMARIEEKQDQLIETLKKK